MFGLINTIVCNLDFRKGDAKTNFQRMFSIYLTMTKTKTCTQKKDNNIQDLDKREEPDYEQSEKMRRSWRKVSGRAGGGGGNGVAATTSFPVSGIMPPAPPAALSSIPKKFHQSKNCHPFIWQSPTHISATCTATFANAFLATHVMLPSLFHKDNLLTSGVSGNFRSHPFPRMKASDSLPEFVISEADIGN